MPVVDERLITKAKALRKRGKTQEEIAVELGVVQGTISTPSCASTALAGSWSRRKKLRRRS